MPGSWQAAIRRKQFTFTLVDNLPTGPHGTILLRTHCAANFSAERAFHRRKPLSDLVTAVTRRCRPRVATPCRRRFVMHAAPKPHWRNWTRCIANHANPGGRCFNTISAMKINLSCADFSFPLLPHEAALQLIALLGL